MKKLHMEHDPVTSAVETLAAPRWEREADWHTFKEKLVNKPRFQFARRRPVLFAVLAATGLSAAAAAVVEVYQHYHFTGVATLDDGTVVEFEADVDVTDDSSTVTATTDLQNATAGGEAVVTTPGGGTAHIIFERADDSKPATGPATAAAPTTKTPANPKSPK